MVRGPLVSGAVEKKEPIGFRIIGVYKLVTAGLSLALAFGLFRLFKGRRARQPGTPDPLLAS